MQKLVTRIVDGKTVQTVVYVCKHCTNEFEPYECEGLRTPTGQLLIGRDRHLNICLDCHDKHIPKISGIKSTGELLTTPFFASITDGDEHNGTV